MLPEPGFRVTPRLPGALADSAGFTLIEVLIAIAVVGILTAIALPQYTLYVQRSRVVEAHSTLNDIRTRQEQFFQDTRRYDDGGGACGVGMPPAGSFTYTCVPNGAPALDYTVTANGAGGMSSFAFNIVVDPRPAGVGLQRNTISVPASWNPAATTCWQTRPGGYC
jgi:type IV pilus assembly protein PilE